VSTCYPQAQTINGLAIILRKSYGFKKIRSSEKILSKEGYSAIRRMFSLFLRLNSPSKPSRIAAYYSEKSCRRDEYPVRQWIYWKECGAMRPYASKLGNAIFAHAEPTKSLGKQRLFTLGDSF
jgi:hypothetical protein